VNLPDPAQLRKLLEVCRETGVTRLRLGSLDVSFSVADVEPLTPFKDADGKPVDLDEGLPPLAQEPEFDRGVDPVVKANFDPVGKA
jgi:hypothetical protein